MDLIKCYLNEREAAISQCYNLYDDYIDEDTNEVKRCGIFKSGLNEDELKKKLPLIDANFKVQFIGSILETKIKGFKKSYYRVHDVHAVNSNAIPLMLVSNIRENFKESKRKIEKHISTDYNITTLDRIKEETGWKKSWEHEYSDKHLYILKNEAGRIKIGIAIDVDKRVKSLSNASGMKIDILRVILFSAHLESKLHKHFRSKKYIGEWFDLDNEDIEYLLKSDLNNIHKKK